MNHVTQSQLEATLRAAFSPITLTVVDESAAHAGHAGAREGSHFRVTIQSAAFNGRTRVARHRLVYDALRSEMAHGIHALALTTLDTNAA